MTKGSFGRNPPEEVPGNKALRPRAVPPPIDTIDLVYSSREFMSCE